MASVVRDHPTETCPACGSMAVRQDSAGVECLGCGRVNHV